MKKQTILYILLIFLVISNGFFLVHHLGKKRGHGDHGSRFSIVKKLDFDEKQMEAYDSMKTVHFNNMKSVSKNIMSLKQAMFSKVSDENVSQSYLDSITGLIAKEEQKKDLEMFEHFKSLRDICNEKQKAQLTKIINDAIKRRGKRRGGMPQDYNGKKQ